jgi:alkanesulfonate monooxygenase SsuD/methylene tetrahydromethanopterin reductase-like flavin-dependent oxidoreductase (luciferase family)
MEVAGNVSSTGIDAYIRMADAFDSACVEVGRDLANVRRSWGGGCACASTAAEAHAFAARWNDDDDPNSFDFVGTPEQIIAQMRLFVARGVTTFMLDCRLGLDLLIREVLPAWQD